MYFGALRAQWDYNTDWSDQRDVDKNNILVLILFKPLVSDGKSRSSKAKSPRSSVQLPDLAFYALCLAICLELLSNSCSPILPNSEDHVSLACLP